MSCLLPLPPLRATTVLVVVFAVASCLAAQEAQPPYVPQVPNPGFEDAETTGPSVGWAAENWGPEGSESECARVQGVSHQGNASFRAESRDGLARPGAYTRVDLPAADYELVFWARAAAGKEALVRAFLAERYCPPQRVGDQWTQVRCHFTLNRPMPGAELNVQNYGLRPGVVWFDDVEIRPARERKAALTTDSRPVESRPQLLYFSANLNYVRETAGQWAARGFAGFAFAHLMGDWMTDIWAEDANAETRGAEDRLYLEAQNSLRECRGGGLPVSALKIDFTSPLPDPYDEEFYSLLRENLRQAARFARGAGFGMIVLDTGYNVDQYAADWPGFLPGHSRQQIRIRLRQRWQDAGRALAEGHPQAQIGVMPEGALYYGPLWAQLFAGLLEGLKAGGGQGQVHVFCSGASSERDSLALRDHAAAVRTVTDFCLDGEAQAFWRQRGKIALGAWPLGIYRAVTDADGRTVGYSGRSEVYGDKLVGAFADKGARYPVAEFRAQMAALRTFSDAYCWIDGHGSSWWQVTPQQADRYAKKVNRFPRDNYLLPAAPNIEEYYRITAEGLSVQITGD
jgi:hypothetical protein